MSTPAIRHQRILASAGSGKTHQLLTRFLTLLLHGAAPGTILASTFTRQAAGQILARLLGRLVEAIESSEKRAQLAADVGLPGLDADALTQTLAEVCRGMGRLRIQTLDSFLTSIVTAFSLELGLPAGSRIIDTAEEMMLRREALERMLNESQTQRLIELLRQLTEGEANASVLGSLQMAVDTCHQLWRQSVPGAWEVIERRPSLEADVADALSQRLVVLAAECRDGQYAKRLATDARAACIGDWKTLLASGLANAIAAAKPYYRKEPTPEMVAVYQPLLAHAVAVESGLLREKNMATRELVERFHQQYESLKRERGGITFADLSYAMLGDRAAPKLEEIFFRIDGAVRHVLLDEVQDTSVPQWRSIEPLVREVVSVAPPERTLLAVGDLKQSIYAWRSGEPQILAELPRMLGGEHGAELIEDRELVRSRRSDPAIIEFVNEVFTGAAQNAAVRRPAAAACWAEGFRTHQSSPTPRTEGFVQVRTVAGVDGVTPIRGRLREAARLAAEIHREAPGAHIGVLVRKRTSVVGFINEVKALEGSIAAGAIGGGVVTDSAMVNLVLDLLRVVDHPDDLVSAFNVSWSPLGGMLGVEGVLATDRGVRLRLARQERRRIAEEGLAARIGTWMKGLAGCGDSRDLRRLRALLTMAATFDERPSLRLGGFIESAETIDVRESRAAPIQAMTIHQAKGLEFDAVILPDLATELSGDRNPTVVYSRAEALGDITAISSPGRSALRAHVPELAAVHDETMLRVVREQLCVLYVALTRARSAMYLVVDRVEKPPRAIPETMEWFVRSALGLQAPDGAEVAAERGDAGWMSAYAEGEEAGEALEQVEMIRPPRGRGAKAARPPSALRERGAEDRDAADVRERRERGVALHALLEQVEWLEEFAMSDAALSAVVEARLPRRSASWRMERVKEFRGMLDRPGLRGVLSRSAGSAEMRVWRERPFARMTEGGVQSGVMDRLVCEEGGGRVVGATVVDFKSEGGAERVEAYREQMAAYRESVAAMMGIEREMVRVVVVLLGSDGVVEG